MADVDASERARRLATEPAQRILDAARRRIAEQGVHGARVRDIARDADVAWSLVNYYFGGKAGLLAEVMEADWTARRKQLRALLSAAQTVDDVVDGLTRALRAYMTEPPGMQMASSELATLALRTPALRARLVRLRAAYRAELAALLDERHRAGALTLDDDPAALAAVLIAIGRGLTVDAATDPSWDTAPAIAAAESVTRQLLSHT